MKITKYLNLGVEEIGDAKHQYKLIKSKGSLLLRVVCDQMEACGSYYIDMHCKQRTIS